MPVTINISPSKVWSGSVLTKLIQLTKALLTPLQQVTGVKSGFVLDNHGVVLGSFVDSSIMPNQLSEIGRFVAQVVAIFEVQKSKPKELECRFKDSNFYIREMGNALAVAVFAPNVAFSLMRMEMNVAAAPIEKDAELQATLKKAAPSCADTLTPDYLNPESMRRLSQIRQAS